MLVIKLGGSLYNTKELSIWLKILASNTVQQSVVIVPGGGPFANQVRSAQKIHNLNDSSAHHMALLAMAQFGILLSDLYPQFEPFYFSETRAKDLPRLSVWLPDQALLSQIDIKQNWEMTSDSLALWLADKLSANQLLLVKRDPLASQSYTQVTTDNLPSLGIIDQSFPAFFNKSSIPAAIVHYQDSEQLTSFFTDNSPVGINLLRNK